MLKLASCLHVDWDYVCVRVCLGVCVSYSEHLGE